MNEESTQANQNEPSAVYHSYLLRMWCTEQAETECWRASLEDLRTSERLGFANLEELFAFLIEQVEMRGLDLGG